MINRRVTKPIGVNKKKKMIGAVSEDKLMIRVLEVLKDYKSPIASPLDLHRRVVECELARQFP